MVTCSNCGSPATPTSTQCQVCGTPLTTGNPNKPNAGGYCGKCGTYIYTDYSSAVGRLNVRTKTLNNANEFPPQVHIFTKDKDPWLDLKDNAICFEKMYDPKIIPTIKHTTPRPILLM